MYMSFELQGSWSETEAFLRNAPRTNIRAILERIAAEGVRALQAATPHDTGLASISWYYEVFRRKDGWEIVWSNSNQEDGFPVAVMIQYGHGTGTGGYIRGRDYINPALQPIFDRIRDEAWKAVTSA